jgi:LPXTG-motif cell wall-anchored protein
MIWPEGLRTAQDRRHGGAALNALRIPVVGAVIAAVALAVSLPAGIQAQQSVTIELESENNSGIEGTAVLTPDGSQTRVVLDLDNAPGPHPAHIHAGNCGPTLVAKPTHPLPNVSDGKSEATVPASMADLMAAPHAINVHKSPQEASVYVACGNISAAAAAAPAAQPAPPAKPAAQPSPAAKPAPAAPAAPATKPAAAPAQAPKPAASPAAQAPAGLPRTGEAGVSPIVLLAMLGGLALIGVGAFVDIRRRSNR